MGKNKKGGLHIGLLTVSQMVSGHSNMSGDTSSKIYKKKSSSARNMLVKAIRELGHTPVSLFCDDCQLFFETKDSKIMYKGKKMKKCDILISRVGSSLGFDVELSTVKQFQLMGMPVINKYLAVARAKNKLRSMQMLTKAKIRVPNTVVVRRFEYLDQAIKQVGGYPVVIKSAFGMQGTGVAIIESRRSLYSALDVLWRYGDANILLIQEYVAESDNSDYRAFVIGDKVVAAMKRKAKKGDFRSNVHQGGDVESIELTEEERKIAVRSTKLMGLDYSGVDIMRSSNGPLVVEVNANPGFAGINLVTSIDVPAALVDYTVKKYHKLTK